MGFLDKFKFKKKPFKEAIDEEEKKGAEDEKKIEKSSDDLKVEKKSVNVKEQKSKKEKAVTKPKSKEEKSDSSSKTKKGDTGNAHKVLIRPIISEKVTDLGMISQYVFEVSLKANKSEIKKAVESLYGVTPIKVRTIKVLGKKARFGRNFGKLRNRKKAIVALKKGETIQVYEGV